LPNLKGTILKDRMLLPGLNENWILTSSDEPDGMCRFRISATQYQPASNVPGDKISGWLGPYQCRDASTAVMDNEWIYQRNEQGGLIRIRRT
jgi:hypothetical protein